MLPIIIYSREILVGFGLEENVSKISSNYLIYSIPAMIFIALWDTIKVTNLLILNNLILINKK